MKILSFNKTICSVLVFVLACTAVRGANIYANFTGDNIWDTFPGEGGGTGTGGWYTPWTLLSGSTGYLSALSGTISTTTQLNGGGNYLYVTATGSSGGTGVGSLYRQIDTTVINLSQTVTYSFDFRVDSFSSSGAINIFSSRVVRPDTSSSYYTWCIYYGGGSWKFYNGNGTGTTSPVDSGLTVSIGTTYHFTITSDPTTHTWSVTVTDGTTPKSASSLGYRYNTYNTSSDEGSYLEFAAADNNSSTSDLIAFSLDNLSITSIPEPTTVSLILFGASSLAALRFRKRLF